MTSNQLPMGAQEICEYRGWDDMTLVIHLIGFIQNEVKNAAAKLREHLEGKK